MVMLGMLVVLWQVIIGIVVMVVFVFVVIITVVISVVVAGMLASSIGWVDSVGLALFRVEKKASISAMVH